MKYRLLQPLAFTEKGQKPINQDYVSPEISKLSPSTRCFVLCDGLGSSPEGENTARIVATNIQSVLESTKTEPDIMTGQRWNEALAAAYQSLDRIVYDASKKPGTTMTCLYFGANGVLAAHIGDSRIYQIRPGQGIIFRTEDHSLVNSLLRAGKITAEQAKTYPRKHVITKAMQPGQDTPCRADVTIRRDVRSGDYFLMCSDGILENADDQALTNILSRRITADAKLEMIFDLCYGKTRDNFSCILIPVGEVIENNESRRQTTIASDGKSSRRQTHSSTREYDEYKYKGLNGWVKLLIALCITFFILAVLFFVFRAPSKKELTTEGPKTVIEQPEPMDEPTPDIIDYVDPRDAEPGNIIEYFNEPDTIAGE